MVGEVHVPNSTIGVLQKPETHESTNWLLSDDERVIFQWIIFPFVCQTVDVFGIGANIVNIICFCKQGFKDPVNVSLLGLALSDLGCLVTLFWTNICLTPAFNELDLPFDTTEFQYLTSAMLHATFTRVTGWITAFITLERCLCITMPLKVKSIVTSKRVCFVIITVYIFLISSTAPVYVVNRLGLKFFPNRNKTLIGLVYTDDREQIEKVSFVTNNVFIPFSAFVVIITCTITLVIKLKTKTEWRKKSATAAQADNVSKLNQKVARMVVMISLLFIACFIPVSLLFIAMSMVPELSITGRYMNILFIIGGIGFVLESVSSSVNIFIYYYMSKNFRTVFLQLFGIRNKT